MSLGGRGVGGKEPDKWRRGIFSNKVYYKKKIIFPCTIDLS